MSDLDLSRAMRAEAKLKEIEDVIVNGWAEEDEPFSKEELATLLRAISDILEK